MGIIAREKVDVKKVDSLMLNEVLEGLNKLQKTLPSKYFYDETGSQLFEEICELDEYYLTRTELEIMRENISEIVSALGKNIQLVELGSGSSKKTRILLDELYGLQAYVPVDISETFLDETVNELKAEFPDILIKPVAADYTQPFNLPYSAEHLRTVAYFPGSTIGNFTKPNAINFIQQVSNLVGSGGALLIGFDLIKDEDVLIDAYDDSKGLTAAFNKNILNHINSKLDANFDLSHFEHRAIFNRDKSRIEMHLVSLRSQYVNVGSSEIYFGEGETIHTENSHKYSIKSFQDITGPYFDPVNTWVDRDQKFCVQLLESIKV